jgi:hypothetical protein
MNSYIDFRVVKDKLRDYLNIASKCNSFNDISNQFTTYYFCNNKKTKKETKKKKKKILLMVFQEMC